MSAAAEIARATAYAHTIAGESTQTWEPLEKHLAEVARMAAQFASGFGAADWGYILGRCHDLGKYSEEFQHYLLATRDPDAGAGDSLHGRVDHSTFGARFVADRIGKQKGQLLAYCIAGHHAGLADGTSDEEGGQQATLKWRLQQKNIPDVIAPDLELGIPQLSLKLVPDKEQAAFQIAFFARMIFSCLVDADRLATEAFCDPEQAKQRELARPSLACLREQLSTFMAAKQAAAPSTAVNRYRSDVLARCVEVAQLPHRILFSAGPDWRRQDLLILGIRVAPCVQEPLVSRDIRDSLYQHH